jgi:phospholipid/cholesterol/gamma-HCH transport system substrate-binding protein
MARAGEDAPLIPLATGGMGELVADPTPMVESIAYATERLLEATTPEQQRLLTARLAELERSTAEAAALVPAVGGQIAPARQTMRDTAASAQDAANQARLMRRDLDRRSRTATAEFRQTLDQAREATAALNARLEAARPSVKGFGESLAGTTAKIEAAREGVQAATGQVQQIERGGAGGLISGPPTPDYQPKKSR